MGRMNMSTKGWLERGGVVDSKRLEGGIETCGSMRLLIEDCRPAH